MLQFTSCGVMGQLSVSRRIVLQSILWLPRSHLGKIGATLFLAFWFVQALANYGQVEHFFRFGD